VRSIQPLHVILGLLIATLIGVAVLRTEAAFMVFFGACVLTMLYSLGEVVWQLFTDARWLVDWTARQFRRDRSDGRTTPDRTGL